MDMCILLSLVCLLASSGNLVKAVPCENAENSPGTYDVCADMPEALRMDRPDLNKAECLQLDYCWEGKNCYFYRTTLDCPVEEDFLRRHCGNFVGYADANNCENAACCWGNDEVFTGLTCHQRKVVDQCDGERVQICNAVDERNCSVLGCCWDPRFEDGPCYKTAFCEDPGPYTGACSKTCGIGWRVVTDGCGRLLCYEQCCDGPCKVTGGNGAHNGSLCRDFQPYRDIVTGNTGVTFKPLPTNGTFPFNGTVLAVE